MAIRSYFFNAKQQANGTFDRCYNAEDVTSYLDLLVGNGVFPNPSTQLQVVKNKGMTVTVKPGQGWINGHKMVSTSAINLNIDKSDIVLDRIDRVIFFVDHATRTMGIEVKKGTPAASPKAPALTRSEQRYEMGLAEITVPHQSVAVQAANIKDTRGNSNLCGWVYGLINQIDTTTVFDQYQAGYDALMGRIKANFLSEILMRKYSANTKSSGNSYKTIPVKQLIPAYDPDFDILEIRVNGLAVPADEYTINAAGSAVLKTAITHAGTEIEAVVFKNSEAEGANIVRKLSGTFTTTGTNFHTFNLADKVDTYQPANDIVEIRVNGLALPSDIVMVSEDGTVNITEAIEHAGTEIEAVIYRNVVQVGKAGEGDTSAVIDALAAGVYLATGENDNVKLSNLVQGFLNGGNDHRQLKIMVYGELDVSEPVGTINNNVYWFNFWTSANTTRRVVVDFANCDRIVIDNNGRDNARFVSTTDNVEIWNAQVVMNGLVNAQVLENDAYCVNCAFWANGKSGSGGTIVGATQGRFEDCRMSVTGEGGKAYGFSVPNNAKLRLTNCEVLAYTKSGSSNEAVGVQVQGGATGAVLSMTNCELPVTARSGYKQDNVIKVNSGKFALMGNVLGKAAALYGTGDGKSEYGSIVLA